TIAVKRVIAIEGDLVITRPPYPLPEQEISLGHVWVEGEHPEHTRWSYDSNSYGAVRDDVATALPTLLILQESRIVLTRDA
ncbi:MAG: hypothetical protein L6R39_006940, partial [Caloplaca ligustica]